MYCNLLQAPGSLHDGKASPYHTHSKDDPSHPDPGAKPAHDEVRRTIEDDIRHVKKGQCSGYVIR